MRKPHTNARLFTILALSIFILLTCSKDTTTPVEPIFNPTGLTVSPSSGAPGTLLNISGYVVDPSDTATEIYIGGELSVLLQDSSGIQTLIPLFLDSASHWPAPPTEAVDVEIRKSGSVVARASAAVTVDSLKHADGATEMLRQDFIKLTGSLRVIYSSLPTVPGEDPRLPGYRDAILLMLDSLTSASDSSLGAVLSGTSTWINGQAPDMSLMDGLLASSGALDFFNEAAGSLGRLTDSLTLARRQGLLCKGGGEDMDLACEMQIYVVLDDYANYFVKPTSQLYANTVGLAAGIMAIGGFVSVHEKIISALVVVFDFVYGTLAPSLFPAEITEFSLTVATDTIAIDAMTNTAVLVTAVNKPATIRATEVLEYLLTALGLAQAPAGIAQSLREVLKNAMQWALGLYRKGAETYNKNTNNSVFIDPEANLPPMSWGPVMVTHADLVELYSFTEDIITGNEAEFEWQGVTRGEGRIQARGRGAGERSKVLIDNALCFGCSYYGGAFGNNAPGTETKSVIVGRQAALDVQITGLPAGTDASVIVTGPDAYSSGRLTASKELKGLDPGDYYLTAIEVRDDINETYKPDPLDATVTLTEGDNKTVKIQYKKKFGDLLLTVQGLPSDVKASIQVTGASGSFIVVGDTLLDSLAAGDYTIRASKVASNSGTEFSPTPEQQTATITGGETSIANVRYGGVALSLQFGNRREGWSDGATALGLVSAYDRLHSTVLSTEPAPAGVPVFNWRDDCWPEQGLFLNGSYLAKGKVDGTKASSSINISYGNGNTEVTIDFDVSATGVIPSPGADQGQKGVGLDATFGTSSPTLFLVVENLSGGGAPVQIEFSWNFSGTSEKVANAALLYTSRGYPCKGVNAWVDYMFSYGLTGGESVNGADTVTMGTEGTMYIGLDPRFGAFGGGFYAPPTSGLTSEAYSSGVTGTLTIRALQ